MLSKGIVKYPGALQGRWQLIADFVETKTMKEVIAKATELSKRSTLQNAGKNAGVEQTLSAKMSVKAPQEEIKASTVPAKTAQPQKQPAKAPAQKTEAPSKPPAEEEGPQWSKEQQKQLEEGMREFPATLAAKERWIKISEKVEGKAPKECFERFKFIVAQLKKKEEDAAAAKK